MADDTVADTADPILAGLKPRKGVDCVVACLRRRPPENETSKPVGESADRLLNIRAIEQLLELKEERFALPFRSEAVEERRVPSLEWLWNKIVEYGHGTIIGLAGRMFMTT